MCNTLLQKFTSDSGCSPFSFKVEREHQPSFATYLHKSYNAIISSKDISSLSIMKIHVKLTHHVTVKMEGFIASSNDKITCHKFVNVKIIFQCIWKLLEFWRKLKRIAKQQTKLGSLGAVTENNLVHPRLISICSGQTEELEGMIS